MNKSEKSTSINFELKNRPSVNSHFHKRNHNSIYFRHSCGNLIVQKVATLGLLNSFTMFANMRKISNYNFLIWIKTKTVFLFNVVFALFDITKETFFFLNRKSRFGRIDICFQGLGN